MSDRGAAPTSDSATVDRLAQAVLAVPGVVALHPGLFGEIGTYLPGRRVAGIRVEDDTVEVHVVIRYGLSVADTAAAVRAAVTEVHPGAAVDVTVEDVVTDDAVSDVTAEQRAPALTDGTPGSR